VLKSQELVKGRPFGALLLATAAIAVAGCSSSGTGSSADSASGTGSARPVAAATASAPISTSPAPQASTGTASGTAGNADTGTPAWQAALGTGVVVYPPQTELPGRAEPGEAIEGDLTEIKAKDPVGECAYIDPRMSTCKSRASQVPASEMPYFTKAALGYVAVDGAEALVGTTGTFCGPVATHTCFTNKDPAAIFSAGDKTFGQLWTETVNRSGNAYALTPAVFVNGGWYVYN